MSIGNTPRRRRCSQRRLVRVPGHGCLNLCAAVHVVLYDRLAKRLGRAGTSLRPCPGRDTIVVR
jgi:tRNA(Leu) C34 or U34 (ribose-2'-O)-methylase TrmL